MRNDLTPVQNGVHIVWWEQHASRMKVSNKRPLEIIFSLDPFISHTLIPVSGVYSLHMEKDRYGQLSGTWLQIFKVGFLLPES